MPPIYCDFNTAQTDPTGRVTLAEDGSGRADDAAVLTVVRPGLRVVLRDETMAVDAVVEHEGGVWYGVPDWSTRREHAS